MSNSMSNFIDDYSEYAGENFRDRKRQRTQYVEDPHKHETILDYIPFHKLTLNPNMDVKYGPESYGWNYYSNKEQIEHAALRAEQLRNPLNHPTMYARDVDGLTSHNSKMKKMNRYEAPTPILQGPYLGAHQSGDGSVQPFYPHTVSGSGDRAVMPRSKMKREDSLIKIKGTDETFKPYKYMPEIDIDTPMIPLLPKPGIEGVLLRSQETTVTTSRNKLLKETGCQEDKK